MIYYILDTSYMKEITFLSVLLAFTFTCIAIGLGKNSLPIDAGRAYAINGSKSVGKPRGAGIIFILTFILTCILFIPLTNELLIYFILTLAAMISGYLDDSSTSPWGELKKGLVDFLIAIMSAITYLNYNSNTLELAFFNKQLVLPPLVFGFLIVVLVWVSINVTNCSDGVDGLCGTLSATTLFTIYVLFSLFNKDPYFRHSILILVVCILGYLWYNASPSKLMMGDAGSRAIGLFIAFAILKSGQPFLYIPVAFMLILDGGLGLIKVSLLRFLHIKVLKNIRTPIHDHVRKNKDWSDSQVVFRFAILQIIISLGLIYALV